MAMEGLGSAGDILEVAEQKVYALRQGRNSTGLTPVSSVLVDVYNQLSEAAKLGNSISGMTTGFPDIDSVIMGLNNSDFILIASRPGMGKTSIALNIALHVAKDVYKRQVQGADKITCYAANPLKRHSMPVIRDVYKLSVQGYIH